MPAIPSSENERRTERPRGSTGRRSAIRDTFTDPNTGDLDLSYPTPGRVRSEERLRLRHSQVLGGAESAELAEDDLPPSPFVPVRRFLSLLIGVFALLAALALVVSAHANHTSHAMVVCGAQLLFVVVWVIASRPPAPRVVAGVGVIVAIGADIAAVMVTNASLEPLAYITAAGFVVAVIGQLIRPAGRIRVTESLGSSLVIVVGVVALGTLIELTRHAKGAQALTACIGAAGVAIAVARLVDAIAPVPRVAQQVPRGGIGIVLGAMAGTAYAAGAGYYLAGLETNWAPVAGLVTALVAVMADLSVGYAEASRHLDGQPPTMWLARHMQGPLGGIAFASPVAYAASVLLLDLL